MKLATLEIKHSVGYDSNICYSNKELAMVRMFLQYGANPQIVSPEGNYNLLHYLAFCRSECFVTGYFGLL
jgi:hypothetical protein